MGVWDDLDARVSATLDWKTIYDNNLLLASRIASRVPVVHVIARTMTPEDCWTLVTDDGSLSLANPNPNTITAERELLLPRSVYFYAGRAYPGVGGIALAFDPSVDLLHTGSITPFDTGGLVCGKVKSLKWMSDVERIEYGRRSIQPLEDWRARFAVFLAAYFNPLGSYVSNFLRPCRNDPDGIFEHVENTWRSWTLEVRYYEGQPLGRVDHWCASEAHMAALDDAISASPARSALLADFARRSVAPAGDDDYGDRIETWIKESFFETT
jgi:hypothetical protein